MLLQEFRVPIELNLSPEEIGKLVGFLGYGNPSAPVWFIGIEEGIGGMTPDDESYNLKARSRFDTIMDLHRAHLLLQENGRPIDIKHNPPSTQVWQYMAKIMLARRNEFECAPENREAVVKNRKAVHHYIGHKLGRAGNETFLTELKPFPQRAAHLGDLQARFQAADPSLETKISARRAALRGLLKNRDDRQLVICYGAAAGWRNQFESLLDVKFGPLAAKSKIEKSPDSQVILLPFFGYGRMSHGVISELAASGLLPKA
jgi:hypothetical protein